MKAWNTIGLLDHMGHGNLGDAATQDVVLANIRTRLPNATIVGFSLVPDDTQKRHGISCYPIRWSYPTLEVADGDAPFLDNFTSRLKSALKSNPFVSTCLTPMSHFLREAHFWWRSYRLLRGLDLLLISGGGQLDELWPDQPYTVFKFSLLAKLAGKNVYLLNVGVGILRRPANRFFTRWVVRLADYRAFRDEESRDRVRSLGVEEVTHVYPDVVYGLRLDDRLKSTTRVVGKRVVGLNPLGFCDPRIWPRKDLVIYQRYLAKITRFSMWLLEQGYELRLFSTDCGVDRSAIEDLQKALGERFVIREPIVEVHRGDSDSVRAIIREMSDFDFVVTSKYHGIVFSHLLGKPVISLSYQSKMDAAMNAVGQSRFSASVEHFEVDWLIKTFDSLEEESRNIVARSTAAVAVFTDALTEQFDGLFPAAATDCCAPALRQRSVS